MKYEPLPYEDRLEYLLWYARNDWLELSIVVDAANRVLGAKATEKEIAAMTLRLTSDLIEHGAPPGDLVSGPSFTPWPGTKEEQLTRLALEMNELGKLPYPGDICCFHVPKLSNHPRHSVEQE